MPRFVILTHDHPRGLHWDLMLEQGGALATWALAEEPAAGKAITAEPLADHRLAYLDYEGPVSGARGEVNRWDRGDYLVVEESASTLRASLEGTRLRGTIVLRREADRWTFTYEPGAGA